MKKEYDRKIGLRYNENIDLFEKVDKRMEGSKCVMAHQAKQNDMEAQILHKLRITEKHINISFIPL